MTCRPQKSTLKRSRLSLSRGFPGCRPGLEVLFVEDELDVGLGVGQTLFLQRCPQLRRAAQEHSHFGSTGKQKHKFLLESPPAVMVLILLLSISADT